MQTVPTCPADRPRNRALHVAVVASLLVHAVGAPPMVWVRTSAGGSTGHEEQAGFGRRGEQRAGVPAVQARWVDVAQGHPEAADLPAPQKRAADPGPDQRPILRPDPLPDRAVDLAPDGPSESTPTPTPHAEPHDEKRNEPRNEPRAASRHGARGTEPRFDPGLRTPGASGQHSLDIPAPFEQSLLVQRGAYRGKAVWSWQLQAGRYQTHLRGELFGPGPRPHLRLEWTSSGALDADGVAPDRYVAQAARGGARAVNFERDTGRISYSGPTGHHALTAGVQDRLSWMVQLTAWLRARGSGTDRLRRGETFVLRVTGPQGDAGEWVFHVLELDPDGSVALQRRAPRRYDLEVDILLGPAPARTLRRLRLVHEGGSQPPWEFRDEQEPQIPWPAR